MRHFSFEYFDRASWPVQMGYSREPKKNAPLTAISVERCLSSPLSPYGFSLPSSREAVPGVLHFLRSTKGLFKLTALIRFATASDIRGNRTYH